MKIKIPKHRKAFKGTFSPKLFSIEMNDFSVEMLLPSLFFLVESNGRKRKRKTDPTTIEAYLEKLKSNEKIVGFNDPDGKRIFEKWSKTSLFEIGKKGLKRNINQILYLEPLTYMTMKAGFPSETSRLRNVHYFIYILMLEALKREHNNQIEALRIIRTALRNAFAEGVKGLPDINAGIDIDGTYDEQTPIDIESLFSLRFMDVFPKAEISSVRVESTKPICQGQTKRFMEGFIKFIYIYKDRMPARELIYNLQTLINFELFIYTLKLIYGTNYLVKNNQIPIQFGFDEGASDPFIYVDCGDKFKTLSREIARQCTSRDIQELSQFFNTNLLLRTLDLIISNNPRFNLNYDELEPHEYMLQLLKFKDDFYVQAAADLIIGDIKRENFDNENNQEENTLIKDFFSRCDIQYSNSVDRLVAVLDQAQRISGGRRFFIWFRDVSGVLKEFGIVKGAVNNRNSWAYVMSNDLLWTLVHLAAIHPEVMQGDKPERIRLADFLEFLKKRYGILIKEVPKEFDSIDANRAARENLASLQRRLKQMGLFENLSDDYEAQYITPQYRNVSKGR